MKYCPKCSSTKTTDEFYKNSSRYDGLDQYCKSCRRAHVYANRHTTEEQSAYHKKWAKKNGNKITQYIKSWESKNPKKLSAHEAVHKALKAKKIVRGLCEVCGDKRTDGHHDDYSKQLEVRWLCRKHHKQVH